jgi:integrase
MLQRSNTSSSTSRLPHSGGRATPHSLRPRDWSGLTASDVLARYRPGKADPRHVLEVLLKLYNEQHTSLAKTVSHKTRHDRAQFLRRFFRDLKQRAGFKILPDPRNLGHKHINAMVQVWREDKLQAPTIQTYLSFLRGLAQWLGKPGFICKPAHYGLDLVEYQRTGIADRDRSWTAQGVDIEGMIDQVCEFDAHVGASLRVIRAFGLRKKESVMLRPHECVVPFEATGLSPEQQQCERYVWIRQGAKGGRQRFVPLNNPRREAAISYAQQVAAWDAHAHLGRPGYDLKQNLRRFAYVLRKFGITARDLGITAHGLRHEALIDEFVGQTGVQPAVRGGGVLTPEVEDAARLAVSRLAGHERPRAASAYLGAVMFRRRGTPSLPGEADQRQGSGEEQAT